MTMPLSECAQSVLGVVEKESRRRFKALVKSGAINGKYDDEAWVYRGRRILFCELGDKHSGSARLRALDELSGAIAKAMVVEHVSNGGRPSDTSVTGRMVAFRHLAEYVNRSGCPWCDLASSSFDRLLMELRSDSSTAKATLYNRACALQAVVDYLNTLDAHIDGENVRFLKRMVIWRHKVENPIRQIEDPHSKEFEEHSRSKYMSEIPVALARARKAVLSHPEIEPFPGFDRVRLEALAPALAVGARIGECFTLPTNCLDRRLGKGFALLRQTVEKADSATAVPIPEVWEEPLAESVTYLMEACAKARARARQIETSGFDFLRAELDEYRDVHGMTPARCSQIKISGRNDVYFADEICACFDVEYKALTAEGRHRRCMIDLPKPGAARMVDWLDDRFSDWDWSCFARKLRGRNRFGVSVETVVSSSGVPRATVHKMYWFLPELRDLLSEMSDKDVLSPDACDKDKARFRSRWKKVRASALANRGGSQSVGISLDRLEAELRKKYAEVLSRHFGENFSPQGNSAGGGFIAKSSSAGVPRRLSEHLVVVWDSQTSVSGRTGILPSPLERSDIRRYLRDSSIRKCIFRRADIRDNDGKVMSFSPHMIRHWVNDAMLRAGANELIIDAWMNRSPRQGRQYDHRTAKERAEQIRPLYLQKGREPNDFLGRKVRDLRSFSVSEQEIEAIVNENLSILHITPYGTCSRELYTSPCDKTLVCIRGFGTDDACRSFQVDVADQGAMENIEKLLLRHQRLLAALLPNYRALGARLEAELDSSEPLDQHVMFIMDVIRSCELILEQYRDAKMTPRSKIDIKVI